MDRNAAITVARALIEEMGIQPGELFPAPEAAAPAPDIDALLPRRRWVPEDEQTHYYLDSAQNVCENEWEGHAYDFRLLNAGNAFPSPEAAAEHAANIRAWVELRERSDKVREGWIVEGGDGAIVPGVVFSTPHSRNVAVAHIGRDRIDALIRWIWNL